MGLMEDDPLAMELLKEIREKVGGFETLEYRLDQVEIGHGQLKETVKGNGEPGLQDDIRSLRNSLDMNLIRGDKVVKPSWWAVDPAIIAKWVAIGAGVVAYIVEILLPLSRL